ncbi:hypothetical protein AARAC_005938 [Aspergillus arachidicola]|uniref:DNA2/NAM7 helicase-like C-terminal domain-containing protein n=1 Tax=Aspergillus arachidicola TaxID=656916 RepID=A0A2G7G5X4_9EURO|nr:hypothetical protein AARAC_005938 [Aspergillus arachidicola]
MSDWDVPVFNVTSGWQADDAANNTSQTVEIRLPPESDVASSEAPLSDTLSNSPDVNASQEVNISDNISTVQSAEPDFNEVEDVPAQDMSLLQLVPFTEHYEPDDNEFSEFVYECDFVSNKSVLTQLDNLLMIGQVPSIATVKQEDDPQKLIAVQPRDSEAAKDFNGTQWKNAHFLVHLLDVDGRQQHKYLPYSWFQKETGVNMRAKVCGANLARKLIIELTVHHDSKIVHKAFLEFHAHTHVRHYEFVNRTVKEFRSNRRKKQNEHVDEALLQNSYIIIRLVTHGGVGIGLDFDAEFLSEEDRQRVIFRLNARYIEYELQNSRTKRKGEEQERFFRQFEHFMEGTRPILAPYRDVRGNPICQWGQFVKRKIVADESNGLVPIPSYTSFATLEENRIIFTYGTFLEWKRETQIAETVSRRQHSVSFLVVKPSTVLALVQLDMPENLGIDQWVPRENTAVEIKFRPPHKIKLGDIGCKGIVVQNIFGLPYPTGLLFLITGANVSFYSAFAVEVGQQPRFLPAKLKISVPRSGAQRQVDAINRLCTPLPHLEALSNVSLNRNASPRRLINPFSGLNLPSATVQAAISEVLQSGIEWSESQIACINSIMSIPNGILLIQGYPGTGKTFTLVAIASILISLNFHVVFSAPSHYAADAICESMDKWAEVTGSNLHPLRLYRPVSEARAFRADGRPRSEQANGETAFGVDTEKFSANASASNTAGGSIPVFIPLEDQIRMTEVLNAIKDESMSRYYGIPAKSLEAHVFRLAYTEGRQLIDTFPSEEQMARSRGDLFDSIEAGDLDPEGEEAGMLQVLRDYAELIQKQSFRQLDDDIKRKALLAFKKAAKQVIREASVIVSTNNNMGEPMVASNFGETAQGIFVIRDEDPKELEPNCWIPITKLRAGPRIKGIISCGDEKQLRPMVLSLQSPDRYNEFAQQLSVSFPERLITMHHPVQKLTEQFRFRPCFLKWLNHRTYDGEMTSHPSTANITVNPKFLDAMQRALDLKDPGNLDLGHIVVSINGSTCEKEEGSNSRFNDANSLWVVKLLIENFRSGGYPGEQIVVITPYMAQVVRYRKSLFWLVQKGILPYSELPKVATTDSMQGKESKVVIYDWVIASANSFGDMGFTIDDNRGSVGMSRMCEAMINILPSCLGSDQKSNPVPQRHNYLGDNIEPKVPYPCAFVQWHASEKNIVTVDCPREEDVFPVISEDTEDSVRDANKDLLSAAEETWVPDSSENSPTGMEEDWSPGTPVVEEGWSPGSNDESSPSAAGGNWAANGGWSVTTGGPPGW